MSEPTATSPAAPDPTAPGSATPRAGGTRHRVAFLGTPAIAVAPLRALAAAADLDVAVVVTNPDRPRGRSGTPVPPPVKEAAAELGLPVLQPRKPIEIVDDLRDLDLAVCAIVAYGALLPRAVLDVAAHGFVNLHYSLLPRWRGAAPVQHALRAGDAVTGVTTFVLDEGMDTGPILHQADVPIRPDDTTGTLLERLTAVGAPLLVESVRARAAGADATPQPDGGSTLAPKITPDDVRIDWSVPARVIVDLVRSANPAPGAHTKFRGKRLKVWAATLADTAGPAAKDQPGSVVTAGGDEVVVAAGEGAVRLDEVQPEGKARMSGAAFANGYQPAVGAPLA